MSTNMVQKHSLLHFKEHITTEIPYPYGILWDKTIPISESSSNGTDEPVEYCVFTLDLSDKNKTLDDAYVWDPSLPEEEEIPGEPSKNHTLITKKKNGLSIGIHIKNFIF